MDYIYCCFQFSLLNTVSSVYITSTPRCFYNLTILVSTKQPPQQNPNPERTRAGSGLQKIDLPSFFVLRLNAKILLKPYRQREMFRAVGSVLKRNKEAFNGIARGSTTSSHRVFTSKITAATVNSASSSPLARNSLYGLRSLLKVISSFNSLHFLIRFANSVSNLPKG